MSKFKSSALRSLVTVSNHNSQKVISKVEKFINTI